MIRRRVPEVMDGPGIAAIDHAQALRSLNGINRLCAVDRHLARCVDQFGPIGSLLDLGCGGGGFLGFLRSRRHPPPPAWLGGLDRSADALRNARQWHSPGIHWLAADARFIPLADESVDVVTCSLFLHHFDTVEAIAVVKEASRIARRGIIIADLRRSRLAWMLTWLALRVISRSWIVHVDGPRSVGAAFQPDELLKLGGEAGLHHACVQRRFPFRMVLWWKKESIRRR